MLNPQRNNFSTFGTDLTKRGQYITTSNELSKEVNRDVFVQGNIKKDEYDRLLEEMSYKSGVQMSGAVARSKLLENSNVQRDNSNPRVVDTAVNEYARETKIREQEKEENPVYVSPSSDRYSGNTINRGRDALGNLNSNRPNTTIFRFNKD